ncbi:MAG TPA: hypothetical protein VG845_08020 [Dehalococcoidia bacterium]|jgi:hypothetical protein|nr:hypothetical protein [Dehalococcoidia bacterium]
MARFLLECPHNPEDCTQELDSIMGQSHELLARFDWGCKVDEHVGWAVVEAGDEGTARMLLPTSIRARAHIVRLNKFTPDDVKAFHEQA